MCEHECECEFPPVLWLFPLAVPSETLAHPDHWPPFTYQESGHPGDKATVAVGRNIEFTVLSSQLGPRKYDFTLK